MIFNRYLDMKNSFKYRFILSLILMDAVASGDELTINITGATPNQGKLLMAVYNNAKDFPDGAPIKKVALPTTIKQHKLDLPKGTYAIAVFQDKNNNNKLDFNFFKMPKEKMGTSGQKYFGKPTFTKAAFELSRNKEINIKLM